MKSRAAVPILGLLLTMLFGTLSLSAQARQLPAPTADVSLTFQVTLPPETPAADTIYIAGNFTGWNPGSTPMQRSGNTASITLSFAAGTNLEYKYTRGSWSSVEKAADGSELANRTTTADADRTVSDSVARWADVQNEPGPDVTMSVSVTLPQTTQPGDTIYIAGNFQGWNPSATPLVRSGLQATGTITVSEGSTLEFKFTRGSWGSVEQTAECVNIPNRTAVATVGGTISASVAAWADRCTVVYDPRVEKIALDSQTLGVAKEFYVYTPPEYSARPGLRYPTLYLFRGHEREWINQQEDSTRGGRNVIDVYEELLAAGQVGPMILVFPGISSADNSVSGMLTNFLAPELTSAAGVGTGRFEDYLVQELVPYVDGHYRTVPTRSGRGVDGFSLGGFMSTKIASQHPELFSTAGAFDGLYFYADATCQSIAESDGVFGLSLFDPVFDQPRDRAYAAANNAPNIVCNRSVAEVRSIRWLIQYGPESAEPSDANFYRGEHLRHKLIQKGVTGPLPAILAGGHNWRTADEHMRQTLPHHWAALRLSARASVYLPLLAR
ncbi:MAG TPA: alpha/beta hydrolase-fold protein [Herpetosiphonaceae bacterium]